MPTLLLTGALALTAGCGGGAGGSGGSGDNGGGGNSKSLTVVVSGTRGTIPLSAKYSSSSSSVTTELTQSPGLTQNVNTANTVTLAAPSNYADRAFTSWTQDGTILSASPTFSFNPGTLTGTGAITAVYAPLAQPSGGFTPAYGPRTTIYHDLPFNFPHWKTFPVHVYLDNTVTSVPSNQQLVLVGITRWVTASGGLINYKTVDTPEEADITVGFGTPDTPTAAGETITAWNGDNEMQSAQVILNPPKPNSTQVTPQNLQTIMAHEFGHALGLTGPDPDDGHSPDPNDTMYTTGNSQVGVITQRDMNTIANVYPNFFVSVFGESRTAHITKATGTRGADGLYHARSY